MSPATAGTWQTLPGGAFFAVPGSAESTGLRGISLEKTVVIPL